MNHASSASNGPTTLYHRSHGVRQQKKGLGHLAPALVLIYSAGQAIKEHEPLTFLTGLEFGIGVLYVVLLVREIRHLRHNPHHRERIAWLEIASAGILGLEGYHIWHRHHELVLQTGVSKFHVLPWIYFALAGVYVLMAFKMSQLDARRYLHLHNHGFALRLKPFGRHFRYTWQDVVNVEPVGDTDMLVHTTDGRHQRISFAAMHNGAAHRDQLLAHAAGAFPTGSLPTPQPPEAELF
ncbi:hypothetical protein [Hymenobacter jejuensis]|uniref:Uncharacterized protein n=1 Tax=Hymenobacter jejuensis TaxID=2502781 RepID=A0A5B8A2A2_9BACT|nr:hypothetical protein [Hymenobacter jejuensis]QDA61277.1 hypothetical protein FHG12_14780 [Hymenobacter jejuensis]